MALDTLFTNAGGGGGSSAGDYVQDLFEDVSLAATNNTGFTDSASTNPLGEYFGNDDAPKYGTKTLWIQDLELVDDRSKWVNNKPTYKITWSESFPGVAGYVYGDVRLRNYSQGKCLEINIPDDAMGVVGVIRRLAWIVNPTDQTTGTADLLTDGSDTGNDITFGGADSDSYAQGYNHYNLKIHSTSLATKDIHDYRLQANEYATLNVAGVVVYFENSSSDIDQFPGSTYVNKEKKTTSALSTIALPSVSSVLGAKSVITKSASNTYSVSTVETPSISTVGVGSSGTNSIAVTTGHGASYPIGSGIVGVVGSSFYIGQVTNQSTDTLTVSPTLGIGLSGVLYKAWEAGGSFPIGATLYQLSYSLDLEAIERQSSLNSFGLNQNTVFYSTDDLKVRVSGGNIIQNGGQGYRGIGFVGATLGFLRVEGEFSAAEIEIAGIGTIHATFSVNGIPAFNQLQGFTGIARQTVFTGAGPGWNSFEIDSGATFGTQITISKINLYQRANPFGVTLGALADFPTYQQTATRQTHNATLMSLGPWSRIYADSLQLTGAWDRGVSTNAAGNVRYIGTSTNAALSFQYYGTDFALIGQGASLNVTIDGASISNAFNTLKSVATLGFHTVALTSLSSSNMIEAIDFKGATFGEFKNLQNFLPRPELKNIPKVYNQTDTPRAAKDGDVWAQDEVSNSFWIKLFGRWFKVAFADVSDDPNAAVFVVSHGTSTTAAGGASQDVQQFNFVSWNTGVSASAGNKYRISSGDNSFRSNHHVIDGVDTGGNTTALHTAYNKNAWASLTTKSARFIPNTVVAFGFLTSNKGSTDSTFGNFSSACFTWNGAGWATQTAWVNARGFAAGFLVNSLLSVCGGYNTATVSQTDHEQKNSAFANSTTTVVPGGITVAGSASAASGTGITSHASDASDTLNSYRWNGSAWSSFSITYTAQADIGGNIAFSPSRQLTVCTGGRTNAQTTGNTAAAVFNGTSWISTTSSSFGRVNACASVI